MRKVPFDAAALQRRLIAFGVAVCNELRRSRRDFLSDHVAGQLVGSATSPAANYAEARAAESRRDFIHKMQVCLKELRETVVWLDMLQQLDPSGRSADELTRENDELIALFVASIQTARRRGNAEPE